MTNKKRRGGKTMKIKHIIVGLSIIIISGLGYTMLTHFQNSNEPELSKEEKLREEAITNELALQFDVSAGLREPPSLEKSMYFSEDDNEEYSLDNLLNIRYREAKSVEAIEDGRESFKDVGFDDVIIPHVDKMVNATFNWSYLNKENKDDFLSFIKSNRYYDEGFISPEELYEEIHKKVNDLEITFQTEFTVTDYYIDLELGDNIVLGELEFSYESNNGSKLPNLEPNDTHMVNVEFLVGEYFEGVTLSDDGIPDTIDQFEINGVYFNE